ncbi:UNVERIFIED_CONTAM: class I heat shock protein [Sesamum angustifolium]|uniref:Class I heat shock protein n=1 Tax=Sesamum angustifolium TaxID=2727405 RepID=A0AAW2PV55_9LAMI
MEFCPTCGNMLLYELPHMERPARFYCPTCPYVCQIESKIKIKRHLRLVKKPIDPIFSEDDRKNLNKTTGVSCPDCNHGEASFTQVQTSRETTAIANARIDWKETPEAHVFKVDVPGLKKEEVKVEVEDGTILQISGERSKEQEEKNDKWHRVERSSGKFLRRFRLPENAKLDQVKAAMENGVLTVTVPKEEVKKPEVKAIDISA